MPELTAVKAPKVAGFVDRGYNHDKKRKRLEEEEKEIARLEAEARGETFEEDEPKVQEQETRVVEEETEEVEDTSLSPEEKSFKKRYGDLRRHMQQKEKEWQEKFESLESRVKGDKNIRPPKSDEDIEQWAEKYPDVASIVETIAQKKAQELFSQADERLKEYDKVKQEATRTKAENKIRQSHSDFDTLRDSEGFHDWAGKQPKWVQDALYENMDDPDSVIRVIDLYKVDMGMTPSAKKQKAKEAAGVISKNSRASVDPDDTSSYLRESAVAKMSNKEFEEREDEINQAIRSGKFIYDLSAGAR